MALETNLNQSPYYDDYSEDKNFHRVLFRPGYAVQTRELNQLQTILQNQIERLTSEVMVDGTVVSGIGLATAQANYVKLRDKDANNRVLLIEDFFGSDDKIANAIVVGETSGMVGRLIDAKAGSEVAAPNFFTIYVDYMNSGANNTTKAFLPNETLVVKSYGGNSFIVAANSITANATGVALKVNTTDGIIYHKGNFIKAQAQSIIGGRYTTIPDVDIGFESIETLIDSNADSSLLDNSSGATNSGAPGANRLKITPTLATRPWNTANNSQFFTIARIQEGRIVRKFTDTRYADITRYADERFYETNGDFATEPFNIRIREHLLSGDNLGRYTTENGGDANKLVAAVESGSGYVGGRKITLHGAYQIPVDKANTWAVKNNRVIGQAYGNYVIVNEAVGNWDYQGLREVGLYDAELNAITGGNFGSQTAVGAGGTKLGTARVRGFEWHAGTPGTPDCQYRLYLFDVRMYSNYSFTQVRSIWQDNAVGEPNAMGDIILDLDGNAKIQESSLNVLVFPFTQKGTKTLKDINGNLDTQFVFKNTQTVQFQTSGTATVTANTAHAGGTETMNDTGSPLSNIDEKNILVIATDNVDSINHTGTVSVSGNTVTGSGTDFLSAYRVGDIIRIKTSPEQISVITEISSDSTLKVRNTLSSGSGVNHATTYPEGHIFDLSSNGSITSSSTSHSINLQRGEFASTFNAAVQFNTLRSDAVQEGKTVIKNRYIKIDMNTHIAGVNGPWGLGVSDVFKINKIYKGSSSSVSTTDSDVTSHFALDNGQRDGYYDHGQIYKNSSSSLDLTGAWLLVEFSYFGRDRSYGVGFYSVDSYPINDADPESATEITTAEIPVFVSPTSGRSFDLRDCVDFRPTRDSTATPNASAASAPTNPSAGTSQGFSVASSGAHNPVPDENFQTDIQYYLPRIDKIVMSSEGTIELVKGIASEIPRTPNDRQGCMTLAKLFVPPYPSLSSHVAKQQSRPDYQVKVEVSSNKRYTFKQIRTLEERIKRLEYYSSLNALESSAKSKQLFNDQGLSRFKNGFLVDNFDSHAVADKTKPSYRAAIDIVNSFMRPTFVRSDIKLREGIPSTLDSVNVTSHAGELLTLPYSEVVMIDQDNATKLRNPAQELGFNWLGGIYLSPSMDNLTDITTLPDLQIDYEGFYDAYLGLAEMTGVLGLHWNDWVTTDTEVTEDRQNQGDGSIDVTVTTQEDQIRDGILNTVSAAWNTFDFGTSLTNVAVRDYMRQQTIMFTGYGLKPNTRVYPYFDKERVFDYCTPADSSHANTGSYGDPLITDDKGNVYGYFTIPNDDTMKFRIGSRRFALQDIKNPETEMALITTSASAEFTSMPIDASERGTKFNIKMPVWASEARTETRVQTTVDSYTIPPPPPPPPPPGDGGDGGDAPDPLAQSFTAISGTQSDGVFITKLDLFFGRKSTNLGVTVQIREMDGGFPTKYILPYASKTLQSSSVNVSDDASVATTFEFEAPVFLKNNTQYAITILPVGNNGDYAVWTGGLGEIDVSSGALITKQPLVGVLFASSDNVSWDTHQNEDLKFKLYKAKFDTSITGTVYVNNSDMEFFHADEWAGKFRIGEKVLGETLMTLGSITGNTAGNKLAVGDTLWYGSVAGANAVITKIVSDTGGTAIVKAKPYGWSTVTNGTSLNIISSSFTSGTASVSSVTANNATGFAYFADQLREKLHIDRSTGNFNDILNGQTGWVRGQITGASAQVTSIENVAMNALTPKIPNVLYSNTNISWSARTTSSTGIIDTQWDPIYLGKTNEFLDNEKKVYSKTPENNLLPVNSSRKSLTIRGYMSSTDENVSPIIDTSRVNAITLYNIVNNVSTDEHKESGDAAVRYISKVVQLADGNDAEDLKVYVNAWRPVGTDVKVYARVHNPEDPELINEKDFTPLTLVNDTVYSDSVDRNDFREFEFGFSANTDGQNFLGSTSANSHARLNTSDDNIVSYKSKDGSIYKTYKNFSIKIVLTSSGSHIVPLVSDMRAIALQQ